MRGSRRRGGAVLIEIMVGIAMLAAAGVAWITLAGQTAQTLREVHDRESQLSAATTLMEGLLVQGQGELAARAGEQRVGEFDVRIAQLTPRLFDVVVADTLTGASVLHTSIYPEPSRVPDAD